MKNKCTIKNQEITLCKELYNVTTNLDTKIKKVKMVFVSDTMRDFIGQITFKYGRKKYDIVALSFCPFCGGKIRDV